MLPSRRACTHMRRAHPPRAFSILIALRFAAQELGATCSLLRMKNKLGCHDRLVVGLVASRLSVLWHGNHQDGQKEVEAAGTERERSYSCLDMGRERHNPAYFGGSSPGKGRLCEPRTPCLLQLAAGDFFLLLLLVPRFGLVGAYWRRMSCKWQEEHAGCWCSLRVETQRICSLRAAARQCQCQVSGALFGERK